MFFSADGPSDAHCSELVTLHRSMNAPVVAIEDLPVGPARAAVALCRGVGEGGSSVDVTIAVRCVRTGQVAFFTAGGELRELSSSSIAMDAALSFAESMGFLFDDDEVEIHGVDGPRVAAKTWQRFLHGDAEEPAASEDLESVGIGVDVEPSGRDELEMPTAQGPARRQGRADTVGPVEASGVVDELGPILSPVSPTLNPEPSLDDTGRESEALLEFGSQPEADEVPFWLSIPENDLPRQSARTPEPVSESGTTTAAVSGDEAATFSRESALENHELLLNVLAETAVDRVCVAKPPTDPRPPGGEPRSSIDPGTEPGLSKFRLKPSTSRPTGDAPADLPMREEDFPDVPGSSRQEANPPRAARYHESNRRPQLLLRLLSRF